MFCSTPRETESRTALDCTRPLIQAALTVANPYSVLGVLKLADINFSHIQKHWRGFPTWRLNFFLGTLPLLYSACLRIVRPTQATQNGSFGTDLVTFFGSHLSGASLALAAGFLVGPLCELTPWVSSLFRLTGTFLTSCYLDERLKG